MKVRLKSPDVLCDVHLERMSPKTYGVKGSSDEKTFNVCESQDCPRHFASSSGYADMLNGQLEQTDKVYQLCEKSSTHGKVALAIVRLENGTPVWDCIYCLAIGPDVKGTVRQIA